MSILVFIACPRCLVFIACPRCRPVDLQTLVQQYLFIPAKYKDCYLAYLLDEFKGQTTIIFVATCNNALRVTVRTVAAAVSGGVALHCVVFGFVLCA
jgi:superfamily II DNA/RNA helicase